MDWLAQVKERCLAERSVATRLEFDKHIQAATNPWHAQMLSTLRDHWWSEIVGELETTMATLAPNPVYRSYGTQAFGPPMTINTTEEARKMYSALYDAGYFPGGVMDNMRIAFADWGVMIEASLTNVLPGAFFNLPQMQLDPALPYQFTCQTVQSQPFDRATGLMKGEILYWGDPMDIVPAQR